MALNTFNIIQVVIQNIEQEKRIHGPYQKSSFIQSPSQDHHVPKRMKHIGCQKR